MASASSFRASKGLIKADFQGYCSAGNFCLNESVNLFPPVIEPSRKMATYIEYELEDGTTVLIESSEPETGVVRASTKGGIRTAPAKKKFEEALTEISPGRPLCAGN